MKKTFSILIMCLMLFSMVSVAFAQNDDSLQPFGLSYCKNFVTTASNFLSYYQLSKDNIVSRLKQMPTHKTLIYGTKDQRIDKQWNQELEQLDMEVITIESANHFFDFEHEFDLLDNIEAILEQINNNNAN